MEPYKLIPALITIIKKTISYNFKKTYRIKFESLIEISAISDKYYTNKRKDRGDKK